MKGELKSVSVHSALEGHDHAVLARLRLRKLHNCSRRVYLYLCLPIARTWELNTGHCVYFVHILANFYFRVQSNLCLPIVRIGELNSFYFIHICIFVKQFY